MAYSSTMTCLYKYGNFNCSLGSWGDVFLYLKNNVHNQNYLQRVNLTFDAMSIRSRLIYDPIKGENVSYGIDVYKRQGQQLMA